MKICEIMKDTHVFLEAKSREKSHLLEEIVAGLKACGTIEKDKIILEELLKREGLSSTGLEKGVAIPHALTGEVDQTILALALLRDGIDFDSADNMPTYVVFLLLGNKKDPGLQLRILAHICRLVKETDFVEKVRKAKSAKDVCRILEKDEGLIV